MERWRFWLCWQPRELETFQSLILLDSLILLELNVKLLSSWKCCGGEVWIEQVWLEQCPQTSMSWSNVVNKSSHDRTLHSSSSVLYVKLRIKRGCTYFFTWLYIIVLHNKEIVMLLIDGVFATVKVVLFVQALSQPCGWTIYAPRWSQAERTDRSSSGRSSVKDPILHNWIRQLGRLNLQCNIADSTGQVTCWPADKEKRLVQRMRRGENLLSAQYVGAYHAVVYR